MTWLVYQYLRAFFVIILQVAVTASVYNSLQKPMILIPPQDMTITTNNASINCICTGTRPMTVDWMKNGKRLDIKKINYLSQSFDGSLHIFFANMKRDQGRYRCIAGNSVGYVISKEALITFPFMDDFKAPDSEVTVDEGSKAKLHCQAPKSFPDKLIYWSKHDSEHPNQPIILQATDNMHFSIDHHGDLHFSYTKDSDAGGYYCNVENHYAREVKRRTVALVVSPVSVQQNHPPRIWSFTAQKAVVGGRLIIECIAQGWPVPSVKIINVNRNGNLGMVEGNMRRLIINRVARQHEGRYACEVSNAFGETDRKNIQVAVEAGPSWSVRPIDAITDIGSTATLGCRANGRPRVQYEWLYNGTRLPQSSDYSMIGGNLTIKPVFAFHAGMYQCIASNQHGKIIGSVWLRIVEIPAGFGSNSLAPRENTHVLVDGIAELTCNPTGSPRPVIRWRHEGRKQEIVTGENYMIMPSGNLRIKKVQRKDEGSYTCTATNKLGQDQRSGYLSVRDGVAIIDAPLGQEIIIGNSMNLSCGVLTSDDLEVSFHWLKNGIRVRQSSRVSVMLLGNTKTTLHITDVLSSDSGLYECKATATDVAGTSDTQAAFISVIGVPGSPTDVTATLLNGTKCLLTWMLGRDNGKPVTVVHIEYRTSHTGNQWHLYASMRNISFFGSIQLKLHPWTSYKFRVKSSNIVGNSTPSLETNKWLETAPTAPSDYPERIESQGSGPSEIRISWQQLDRTQQNGPGIYYVVHHRQSATGGKFDTDKVTHGLSSFILKGAEFYTEFEFQVQAGNAIGLGPKSPLMTGYTGERLPLGAPKNLRIEIKASRKAIGWWDGVSNDRYIMRGQLKGYKLLFWIDSGTQMPPRDIFYQVANMNTTQLVLAPATSYMFQVVAFNKIGQGPGSNIVGPLTTSEDVPSKPQRVWISQAEMGSANVSWLPPDSPNGILLHHTVSYNALPDGIIAEKVVSGSIYWAVVSNLQPGISYNFSVSSTTKVGDGPQQTEIFDFTKLPLAKPSELKVTAIGKNTIVLTWSPINRPEILGYKVYYWKEGDDQSTAFSLMEGSMDLLTPISGLLSNTNYYFQVAGLNQFGAGPRTDPLLVTTLPTKSEDVPRTSPSSSSKLTSDNTVLILSLALSIMLFICQRT